MEKGKIVELKIEDVSTDGAGIGRTCEGMAVFVKGATVGDTVKAELIKIKKRYAFARLIEFVEVSPWRQDSLCGYIDVCGGCPLGGLSYEGQLTLKEKQVRDRLERLGGLKEPDIRPIIAMDKESLWDDGRPYRYRNKAGMAVSTGGLMTRKGGIQEPVHEPRVGFYGRGGHDVIDCEDCLLQSQAAVAAAKALRRFMEEDHITSYDPRWEKGLMRHMIVRTAEGTGQVMVILVINGKAIPNAQKLVEMLDDAIYDTGYILESVVINVNRSNTSQILGEECITIAGKSTITEELAGMRFEISPLSFYQVNPEQMVKLYAKALEYAGLGPDGGLPDGATILDLYCGVGTIGLFAAKRMNELGITGGRVIGIESVSGAVLDANRNAVINGIVNALYVCGKAEEELPKMINAKPSAGRDSENVENGGNGAEFMDLTRVDRADVVILDPPRAGCDRRLLEAIVQADPIRIVYVSCDPATLARDVKWLGENGYVFVEATPVDMFPHTGHCEVVVKLNNCRT